MGNLNESIKPVTLNVTNWNGSVPATRKCLGETFCLNNGLDIIQITKSIVKPMDACPTDPIHHGIMETTIKAILRSD